MAAQTDTSAKPRAPLSRERVMRAAVALADKGGIESLTMRRLGQELRVEAMSLYNHVANKEDIVDGIVDLVFGEIDVPSDGAGWKTAMRQRAISARDVLLRHPWATSLMQSRTKPGPATLRHNDSVLGSLRAAGFTVEMAAHAFSVMDGYIYGFALQQMNLPSHSSEEATQLAEGILRKLPANEYPHLAEMITEHAMNPGYDYADEFEFGLDLILDGLERVREPA
ncbi:MAG TPA: TetR/AcrR family transcriptional regulator [Candidatus Limnocylindria bacterium]|nr:TetR/AcrR family transcriptional regulator [Candidatus Limnocylindria bacterium]